jgi:hypothetical protein
MPKRFVVLVILAVFALGACGGDDSDETDSDGDATDATAEGNGDGESDGDGQTSTEAPGGSGYGDEVRSNFMNACVAQPGASEAVCECTFDEISSAVPFEEFTAYEGAVQQDPATPAPSWLAEAITACT